MVSITIFGTPISYGNADPGTTVEAQEGNGFPLTVRVDNTTTVDVDIYIRSENESMHGTTPIMVGNITFANNSAGAGNKSLATSYQLLQSEIPYNTNGQGVNISIYWWLSVPSATVPGTYSNTVSIYTNSTS
jgi:hypothetical protein